MDANSDWEKPDNNCEHHQMIDGISIGEGKITAEKICNDTVKSTKIHEDNSEAKLKEFKKSIISKNSDSKHNQTTMNVLKDEGDNDSKVVGAIATKDDSWLHDDTYKVTRILKISIF